MDFFPHAEGYVLREMGYEKLGRPVYSNIYIFTIKDHLGNVRTKLKKGTLLLMSQPIVLETTDYYPIGLAHQALTVSSDKNKYQYNDKEFQDELGLNAYDFEARLYDPSICRTLILDPHAENYFYLSSYSFLNNNPILFIDPDGKDFIISYIDDNNKSQDFRYTRGATPLPDNQFVKNFVAAYHYNVKNGGGKSMKSIAENRNTEVYVQFGELSQQSNEGLNVIDWNDSMGLETSNGYKLSPATILEHESAHALNAINDKAEKNALLKCYVPKYINREEERVITGTEQTTARANREIPIMAVTRTDHGGRQIITNSSTSNKVNELKTNSWRKKVRLDK